MPAPQHIRASVEPMSGASLTEPCAGAAFHSPMPLRTYEHFLTPTDSIWLCPSCEDNLRIYEELQGIFVDGMEWPLRREFGNRIRGLARRIGVLSD